MIAMSKIIAESRDYDLWTNLAKTLRSLKLHSYFVPFVIIIAIIFGPHHKNNYNHKWSSAIMKNCYNSVLKAYQGSEEMEHRSF